MSRTRKIMLYALTCLIAVAAAACRQNELNREQHLGKPMVTNVVVDTIPMETAAPAAVQETPRLIEPSPLLLSEQPKVQEKAADPPRPATVSSPPAAVVAPSKETNAEPGGRLKVLAEPTDSEVYVDDKRIGSAPVTLTLKDGIHLIEVRKPGHKSYRKVVRIIEDSDLTLRARLDRE